MKDDLKQRSAARYEQELRKGERFWPDSIYKDLLVSLGIFILLILLATFAGVAAEPIADPSDASYIPRPEWYFLFLFKFLVAARPRRVISRLPDVELTLWMMEALPRIWDAPAICWPHAGKRR